MIATEAESDEPIRYPEPGVNITVTEPSSSPNLSLMVGTLMVAVVPLNLRVLLPVATKSPSCVTV